MPGAHPFTAIFGGLGYSAYALGADGHLYAWGNNSAGQLGDGTTTSRNRPVQVHETGLLPAALPFVSVSTGAETAIALGSDGYVYAWGRNDFGQLGDGTTIDRLLPTRIDDTLLPSGALPFTAVAGGGINGYALGSDGHAYAWGNNGDGQLGDGTITGRSRPGLVLDGAIPSTAHLTEIGGGSMSGYALDGDGNAYAWGRNNSGQLGDGTQTSRSTPVLVSFHRPRYRSATSAPASPAPTHWAPTGCPMGGDPTGRAPSATAPSSTAPFLWRACRAPCRAACRSSPAAAAIRRSHWDRDGHAYTSGSGTVGQLGNGTFTDSVVPVRVFDDVTVTGVTFAGVAGTGLSQAGGSWSVQAPAAAPGTCGPVDVVVTWTQLGATHTDTYPGGFVYGTAPAITAQPASDTIPNGGTFTATVGVTGDRAPAIKWQSSTDGGATWIDVPGAIGTTLTAPGLTSTIDYQAVATNCFGAAYAATSNTVTATVLPPAHTVAFDSAGGGSVPSQTVAYGSPAAAPTPAPARSGYTLDGWFTAATGGAQWNFSNPVTADLALYAHWAAVVAPVVPSRGALPKLALTGSDIMLPGIATAVVLLAIGGLLLVVARRRDARRSR